MFYLSTDNYLLIIRVLNNMGMAIIKPRETPKPRYKGTVVCSHCFAEYKPGNWCYGYSEGTQSTFIPMYMIKDDCCPACNHKRN